MQLAAYGKPSFNMKTKHLFITNLIIISLLLVLLTAFIIRIKQDIEILGQNTLMKQKEQEIKMYNLGYRMGQGYFLSCHE